MRKTRGGSGVLGTVSGRGLPWADPRFVPPLGHTELLSYTPSLPPSPATWQRPLGACSPAEPR